MTNEENNYPQEILDLLFEKNFDILSQQEKELIRTHMTEKDYRRIHNTFLAVSSELKKKNSYYPSNSVKKSLDLVFIKKHKQKNKLVAPILELANYRLPAWQLAASIVLILAATWHFRPKTNKEVLQNNQLALADTIYIEKEKPERIDTVYIKETEKQSQKTDASIVITEKEKETNESVGDAYYMRNIHIVDFKNTTSPGRSIKEDSLPAEFMVGIL